MTTERLYYHDPYLREFDARIVAKTDHEGRPAVELDRTAFWRPTAQTADRSLMNVTFRLPSEELEKEFVKASTAAGLDGLKGHRSVGGIRASIYNAFPAAGVETLVDFMREFERTRG